jgi:hypothetical protein
MQQYRSRNESIFQGLKSRMTLVIKLPRGALASKMCKRNGNIRIALDEALIEISEPKERLNILNLARFRPVHDNLDIGWIHLELIRPHQKSQIFNRINIKRIFFTISEESMLWSCHRTL